MLANLLWINGRNGRGKYWLIGLTQFGVLFMMCFIPLLLSSDDKTPPREIVLSAIGNLGILLVAALFWVGVCNTIRRYHDRGKSAWWILFGFIPIIGASWQFIELGFLPGDDSDNAYGPPPGSVRSQAALQNEVAAMQGQFSKFDDAYMQDYVAKLANTQGQPTQTPSFGQSSGHPTFGKR